jgi:hypothetical protein
MLLSISLSSFLASKIYTFFPYYPFLIPLENPMFFHYIFNFVTGVVTIQNMCGIFWCTCYACNVADTCYTAFYVLLTVHLGMIFVNNQLDAQFLKFVYFHSLHASGTHVPIIRRIIVSLQHLVYVTLCIWPSGMQIICIPNGHLQRVT